MSCALLIFLCIAEPGFSPERSTAPPATTAPARPANEELCDQARHLLRAGQFAEAAALLEEVVTRDPTSLAARTLLADAYQRGAQPAQAAEQYRRIGDVQAEAGRHALAAEAFQKSLTLQDNPTVRCSLAAAYCRLGQVLGPLTARWMPNAEPGRRMDGQYVLEPDPQRAGWFVTCPSESAVYQVQAALDAGLDTLEVHLLHARVWLLAGKPARAIAILEKRAERLPERESGAFWHLYGQAALAVDDLETSTRCLKEAVMRDPNRFQPTLVESYQALADRYSRRGNLLAYIKCLEDAVHLAPRDADLHCRLGNAYGEAGRSTDAARQWQITLELNPDHPQRARLLEQLRRAASSGRGLEDSRPAETDH